MQLLTVCSCCRTHPEHSFQGSTTAYTTTTRLLATSYASRYTNVHVPIARRIGPETVVLAQLLEDALVVTAQPELIDSFAFGHVHNESAISRGYGQPANELR